MGAEIGATCSIFPYDVRSALYLKATGRAELAGLADEYAEYLRPDPEIDSDPERYYDRVIDIDLDDLEPHVVGPHTPDLDRPVSELAASRPRRATRSTSRTRSSGPARTRRTRTSDAPRTSPARRRPPV